ncbi:MAG: hypothetical protein QOH26_2033, partial [Actinomycetota bacterium]|nr:hypothetical protein [Actinomycetota bacterium]
MKRTKGRIGCTAFALLLTCCACSGREARPISHASPTPVVSPSPSPSITPFRKLHTRPLPEPVRLPKLPASGFALSIPGGIRFLDLAGNKLGELDGFHIYGDSLSDHGLTFVDGHRFLYRMHLSRRLLRPHRVDHVRVRLQNGYRLVREQGGARVGRWAIYLHRERVAGFPRRSSPALSQNRSVVTAQDALHEARRSFLFDTETG